MDFSYCFYKITVSRQISTLNQNCPGLRYHSIDRQRNLDSFNLARNANTVSCGNLTCHNICKATLTGYKIYKHSNHLSTNCLYRDSTKTHAHHDSKYCAIPACYRDNSLPTNGTVGRIAALVTQTTTTAVPLVSITLAGLTRLTVLYTLIRLPPVVCGLNWIT